MSGLASVFKNSLVHWQNVTKMGHWPDKKNCIASSVLQVQGPSANYPEDLTDDLLTPCFPNSQGAIKMDWTSIPGDKLLEPVVTMVSV